MALGIKSMVCVKNYSACRLQFLTQNVGAVTLAHICSVKGDVPQCHSLASMVALGKGGPLTISVHFCETQVKTLTFCAVRTFPLVYFQVTSSYIPDTQELNKLSSMSFQDSSHTIAVPQMAP